MARKAAPKQDEPIEKQMWKAADKLRKNIDAAENVFFVPETSRWSYLPSGRRATRPPGV